MGGSTVSADPAVAAAFSAGWLVAQLHGPMQTAPLSGTAALPTARELCRADRVRLALDELDTLLGGPLADVVAGDIAITTPSDRGGSDDTFVKHLEALHIELLIRLTVAGHRLGDAYSLGRSLSDTCWLPCSKDDFRREFTRTRLGRLQGWLTDLSGDLPPCAAAVVAQSLDHWADWVAVHADLDDREWLRRVAPAAKAQGDHWRSLLVGDKDPAALLTPEAYVQAGEQALQRATKIVWSVIRHLRGVLVVVAVAMAAAMAVALRYAGGTAKVWGSLVPLAAGFGVTGAKIRSTALSLGKDVGTPLLNLAEVDAMGWTVTWLPAVADDARHRKQLRARGVAAPRPLPCPSDLATP